MLFANLDVTTHVLTWCITLIADHAAAQTQLREELNTVPADLDPQERLTALEELHLFDNVVREGLRLVSPVHSSLRVAMHDDEIPVSEAVKMKDGSTRWNIKIRKGQFVHVAMEGFNLDRTAWGQDAWEFRCVRTPLHRHCG